MVTNFDFDTYCKLNFLMPILNQEDFKKLFNPLLTDIIIKLGLSADYTEFLHSFDGWLLNCYEKDNL